MHLLDAEVQRPGGLSLLLKIKIWVSKLGMGDREKRCSPENSEFSSLMV
jgi:hypothetical protein